MNSIYNPAHNQQMLERIDKLSADSQALWGKMNAAQMIEHNIRAIQVAFGKQSMSIGFVYKILGKLLKKKVFYGNQPMQKNSPTAPEFVVKVDLDFENKKEELKNLFATFAQQGPEGIKVWKHPFWGNMSIQDWDALMWRHLDHHLKQFGV